MIVTFDSNAYRYLAEGCDSSTIKNKVAKLVAAERAYQNPIFGWITDTVSEELLFHLIDPDTELAQICFCACQAQYWHCCDNMNKPQCHRLLPSLWLQLMKEYYDIEDERLKKNEINLADVLCLLTSINDVKLINTLPPGVITNIGIISTMIQEVENGVGDILEMIYNVWHKKEKSFSKDQNKQFRKQLLELKTSSENLNMFIAKVILDTLRIRTNTLCGFNSTYNEELLRRCADRNQILIELYRNVILGLNNINAKPRKEARVNTIWDSLIAFSAGKNITINGVAESIVLVTADEKIINAAETVATNHNRAQGEVIRYNDYMQMLGLEDFKIKE